MRLKGQLYESLDREDNQLTFTVTDAIITPTRLAVDWGVQDDPMHLEASSSDGGRTYSGTYGWPRPNPDYRIELKVFTSADGTTLLLGRWLERDSGEEGDSLFELTPIRQPIPAKRATRQPDTKKDRKRGHH